MDAYVLLAKNTIDLFTRENKIYQPKADELPAELRTTRAGAFVSIHENEQLRGCIGTIAPTQPTLADEIIANAISASHYDPRFPPMTVAELDHLVISVDVLGEAEPVTSTKELDVKRYGVIVEKGTRRGLLLPDLEGVDTVEDQITIARTKAGIYSHEKDVRLYRFEVVRHV